MRYWIAVAVFALSSMSYAQPTGDGPPILSLPPAEPRFWNVARPVFGVGFYDSGWYDCYYYPYGNCSSGSYGNYIPFTAGIQVDIHLGGTSYLTPGVHVLTGTIDTNYFNGTQNVSFSNHITLWEPTLDYVGKLGQLDQETLGRFRIGGGLYFGSGGGNGGGFRAGFGASFFNKSRIGLGLDAVFEASSFRGYWFSGIQLLISPEIHF